MIEIKTFIMGALQTNCYLVYDAARKIGFLIDPASFDRGIQEAAEKNGIRIKGIINTHGHPDHTTGNKKFGYPVFIHEGDRAFLKAPPSKFLKDNDKIGEDGMVFEVIHTPGHTPGGICLKLGEKIFTGDTLFREGVGRTDFEYGNENDLLHSIRERLMVFGDNVEIFPGHGPSSTIGHERKSNPFI